MKYLMLILLAVLGAGTVCGAWPPEGGLSQPDDTFLAYRDHIVDRIKARSPMTKVDVGPWGCGPRDYTPGEVPMNWMRDLSESYFVDGSAMVYLDNYPAWFIPTNLWFHDFMVITGKVPNPSNPYGSNTWTKADGSTGVRVYTNWVDGYLFDPELCNGSTVPYDPDHPSWWSGPSTGLPYRVVNGVTGFLFRAYNKAGQVRLNNTIFTSPVTNMTNYVDATINTELANGTWVNNDIEPVFHFRWEADYASLSFTTNYPVEVLTNLNFQTISTTNYLLGDYGTLLLADRSLLEIALQYANLSLCSNDTSFASYLSSTVATGWVWNCVPGSYPTGNWAHAEIRPGQDTAWILSGPNWAPGNIELARLVQGPSQLILTWDLLGLWRHCGLPVLQQDQDLGPDYPKTVTNVLYGYEVNDLDHMLVTNTATAPRYVTNALEYCQWTSMPAQSWKQTLLRITLNVASNYPDGRRLITPSFSYRPGLDPMTILKTNWTFPFWTCSSNFPSVSARIIGSKRHHDYNCWGYAATNNSSISRNVALTEYFYAVNSVSSQWSVVESPGQANSVIGSWAELIISNNCSLQASGIQSYYIPSLNRWEYIGSPGRLNTKLTWEERAKVLDALKCFPVWGPLSRKGDLKWSTIPIVVENNTAHHQDGSYNGAGSLYNVDLSESYPPYITTTNLTFDSTTTTNYIKRAFDGVDYILEVILGANSLEQRDWYQYGVFPCLYSHNFFYNYARTEYSAASYTETATNAVLRGSYLTTYDGYYNWSFHGTDYDNGSLIGGYGYMDGNPFNTGPYDFIASVSPVPVRVHVGYWEDTIETKHSDGMSCFASWTFAEKDRTGKMKLYIRRDPRKGYVENLSVYSEGWNNCTNMRDRVYSKRVTNWSSNEFSGAYALIKEFDVPTKQEEVIVPNLPLPTPSGYTTNWDFVDKNINRNVTWPSGSYSVTGAHHDAGHAQIKQADCTHTLSSFALVWPDFNP